MDFALIGSHPHGLLAARALHETGQHRLIAFAGPTELQKKLPALDPPPRHFRELEELLAQRDIELVIVADDLEHRPNVLRRALQSEKHVLCVHPADLKPDIAYEAGMIQADTKRLLLPLLTLRFSPGLARLQQLVRERRLGEMQLTEFEQTIASAAKAGSTSPSWEASPVLNVWDALRLLGGEVREVSALSTRAGSFEEAVKLKPDDPVTINGRFEAGGFFRVLVLPASDRPTTRVLLQGDAGRAELLAPEGLAGAAELTISQGDQIEREAIAAVDPWPLVLASMSREARKRGVVSWQDEVRSLELFDAVRRSVERGRVVPLVYQEFTEEATFKGVMTTAGCGLLWLVLALVFAGVWAHWLWYAIPALLGVFLALQVLRWVVPREKGSAGAKTPSGG